MSNFPNDRLALDQEAARRFRLVRARNSAHFPGVNEEMTIRRGEFVLQLEKSAEVGFRSGFAEGWAAAYIQARRGFRRRGLAWFIAGVIAAEILCLVGFTR